MLLRIVAMFAVIGLVLPATPQADEQVTRIPSLPEWQLVHRVVTLSGILLLQLQHRITGTVPVHCCGRERWAH